MSERVRLPRAAAPGSSSPLDQLAGRRSAGQAQDKRAATATAIVTRAVPPTRLAARELPGHHAGLSPEQSAARLDEVLALISNAGPGAPLPDSVAARVEAEFGQSFAHVRVHLDAVAVEACALLGAQAFTLGDHIYFGAGQFAPDTDDGARLLRHELTHVVQHAHGELASQGRAELVAPSSAAEIEARAAEVPKPRPSRAMPAWTGGLPEREAHEPTTRRATASSSAPVRRPLDAALRARLGPLLGFELGDIEIVPESPVASGSTKAVTRDGEVHFRPGSYQPGTQHGDWLIAHELAHVVQQRGGRGERHGTRRELEQEADHAATLVTRGIAAPIALRADRAVAYAFDESEERERAELSAKPVGARGKASGASQPAAAEVQATQEADDAKATVSRAPAAKLDTSQAQVRESGSADAGQEQAHGATVVHAQAPTGGAQGTAEQPAAAADAKSERSAVSADHSLADAGVRGEARGAAGSSDPKEMLSSLAEARPSDAASVLAQVRSATPAAFEAERTKAQSELPSMPAPTGLPAKAEEPKPEEPSAAEASPKDPHQPRSGGPANKVPDTLVREAPSAPQLRPTELPGPDAHAHGPQHDEAHDEALATSAQQALLSIRLPAAKVSTKATSTPSVDLAGEADPAQVPETHQAGGEQLRAASCEAAKAIGHPRGERNILPIATAETLQATLPPRNTEVPKPEAALRVTSIDAEALASIDAEAASALHAKIAPERDKYAQGKTAHEAEMKAAHAKHRTDVAAAEADARTRQESARAKAQTEIGDARADWQQEIDKVGTDFRAKAEAAKTEHRGRMDHEQRSANRQAAAHLKNAEREANAAKRRAEHEAAAKKAEAGKESNGFWGWVKSKAKAFIDGIKAAVNFIYDKLRSVVKGLFEAAKQLALAAIELGRKAIVGLIKGFGALLKGFVQVALAAFPKLRDRMLRRIDQAVQRAEHAVNAAADALKTSVAAMLDFLASTIDKFLGFIQDLYNAALTVVGMLVSGELQELLRKVGQLIDAAKTAPEQFETAAYEELLGGDLDQPLSPAELIAAGRVPPTGTPGEGGAAEPNAIPQDEPAAAEGEPAPTGDGAEASEPAPGPPWTTENVGVDEVATGESLEPELVQEVMERTGGGDGEVEFGESNDETRSLDYMLGTPTVQAEPTAVSAQDQGGLAHEPAAQPGAQVAADGLAPRERAQVKWQLMKKGLADWWSQNWPYVLAGGVLAIAGFIVANILTGGAILAALPAIMAVVGYVMAGVAIAKITEHVRDYLLKAWNGDLRGGGKSLAKGLAAGAIELIMMLTFKAGAAAMRGARAAARGAVGGARTLARGAARTGRAAARGLARGAQYLIRAGKVLLRGVGRAVSRGVKHLRELGARLLSRTRFKGFRIRITGRRFVLEGRINPWVKIVDGEFSVSARPTKNSRFVTEDELAELRRGGTPQPDRLAEFDARRYHETTTKGVGEVGDGLTGDHIPSRAALVERFKLDNPGKPVPEDLINREGITVVLKGTDHATLSRTYAGRNTAEQILEDAKDLGEAFRKDATAILNGLKQDNRLTMEVVGAYQKAYRANVMKGVFPYSADIDDMFNNFMKLAKT